MSIYQQAEQALANIDADWRALIQQVGSCDLKIDEQAPYQALIRAVAYQQLHANAAKAILGRLLEQFQANFPSPDQLLALSPEHLRACGFSYSKIETLHGIAVASQNGILPTLTQAQHMSDEELIQRLTSLRGIGPWTVEMMLIFNLGRQDILPVDDFAVREGYKRLKRIEHITPKRLAELGQAWAPYRSIAAWYLWRVPK